MPKIGISLIYNGQSIQGVTLNRSSMYIPTETEINDSNPVIAPIPSGNINFSDSIFKSYCVELFDTNCDGEISYEEASVVTSIRCDERSISNMDEIKYFTALVSLDCWHDNLTNLDVSKNPFLRILECSYNRLTSLDISNNRRLQSLACVQLKDGFGHNLLETLYIGDGQQIEGITSDRNSVYIPDTTNIVVKTN